MEMLYVCNKEMRRTNMLEAILSKTCSMISNDLLVKNFSTYSKILDELVSNIFLLWDNIKKIMVFK
jgi:hypothetical protein